MLVVDLSGSGLFGSGEQSKRELAAEIASVLAFSAIRNNDKVGLILFTDTVEKYIPPRKGRRHVLRVIRDILFYEPRRDRDRLERTRSNSSAASFRTAPSWSFFRTSWARQRPLATRWPPTSVARSSSRRHSPRPRSPACARPTAGMTSWPPRSSTASNSTLPNLGYLVFKDAETGEVVEVNTGDDRKRQAFAERQEGFQRDLQKIFRAAKVDSIQLRTDRPYAAALGRFFEMREKRRRHG